MRYWQSSPFWPIVCTIGGLVLGNVLGYCLYEAGYTDMGVHKAMKGYGAVGALVGVLVGVFIRHRRGE